MRIPVVLAPYNAEWPTLAARYAEQLRFLSPNMVEVHHVGSTSVPGLTAKPIIDLMPLVSDLARLDEQRPDIEALGYVWRGEYGIPGRRHYILDNDAGIRLVNLHFLQSDNPLTAIHIAFRDYLAAHPDVARAYEREKQRARALHPHDSHAYSNEKSAWIEKTQADAVRWAATRAAEPQSD